MTNVRIYDKMSVHARDRERERAIEKEIEKERMLAGACERTRVRHKKSEQSRESQ